MMLSSNSQIWFYLLKGNNEIYHLKLKNRRTPKGNKLLVVFVVFYKLLFEKPPCCCKEMHVFRNRMQISNQVTLWIIVYYAFYCVLQYSEMRRVYWTDFEVVASHENRTWFDREVTWQYLKVTGQIVSCHAAVDICYSDKSNSRRVQSFFRRRMDIKRRNFDVEVFLRFSTPFQRQNFEVDSTSNCLLSCFHCMTRWDQCEKEGLFLIKIAQLHHYDKNWITKYMYKLSQ